MPRFGQEWILVTFPPTVMEVLTFQLFLMEMTPSKGWLTTQLWFPWILRSLVMEKMSILLCWQHTPTLETLAFLSMDLTFGKLTIQRGVGMLIT